LAWTIDDLDTPCVTIDLDAVERNLTRAQDYCRRTGLALRPHIKTHKIPELARRQVELGAVGITCQKLGEAEVMADAGIDDILITYNIVGRHKLERLAALARRVRLTLVFDSREAAEGVSSALSAANLSVGAMVECDTGAGRCGVQSPAEAAALAAKISTLRGLGFRGLMTYAPKGKTKEPSAWLAEAILACERKGLPVEIVSTGGTAGVSEGDVARDERGAWPSRRRRLQCAAGDRGARDDHPQPRLCSQQSARRRLWGARQSRGARLRGGGARQGAVAAARRRRRRGRRSRRRPAYEP
jgi:D-serine deaminase-like pyridoxal phosphate-dependent protein